MNVFIDQHQGLVIEYKNMFMPMSMWDVGRACGLRNKNAVKRQRTTILEFIEI